MIVIERKIYKTIEKIELIVQPLPALLFRSLTSNAEFGYGKPKFNSVHFLRETWTDIF